MDHNSFLKSLPAPLIRRLSQRSNTTGLVHLAGHIGLLVLFGSLIALRAPLWWLLLPVQGIVLCFLFCLEHEATHKTPFASAGLNEWVGRITGLVILQPFEWFRYFHLAHHRHTHDPKNDPELLAGAKPAHWPAYLIYITGLPFWIAMARQLVRNARGRAQAPYLPARALARIRTEARWMLLVYLVGALSLVFSPLLFWIWLLPMLLGQPFLRLYLLAEHGRCAHVADMFDNTRTTFTTAAVRFLAWNMPYHVEHHVMPNVPFHQLPTLNALIGQHLRVTEDGYVKFSRKYAAGLK